LDSFNDNIDHTKKRLKRKEYFDVCLKAFMKTYPSRVVYNNKIAEKINKAYWDFAIKKIRVLMQSPNERIDHHKIISGTQCAIMTSCLLRTEDTFYIKFQSEEARENNTIRKLNADFALYVALDILEQWNEIDITPLKNRKNFLHNHVLWLKEVTVVKKGKTSFPFFAISQLWYLAEELCISVKPVAYR